MRPKVLIGIPRKESAGCMMFWDGLSVLETVPGTIRGLAGKTDTLPAARNAIVREALAADAEFLWFLDDDQPMPRNSLVSLLKHDLDAVIGLSTRRKPPFLPLAYHKIRPDGMAEQYFLNSWDRGVIPMAGAGMNGLLIKTDVLRVMADPWFTFEKALTTDEYAEDFPFYRRLREAGFQLHLDLDVCFGHESRLIASAKRLPDGNWVTEISTDEPHFWVPQIKAPSGIIAPFGRPDMDLNKLQPVNS